ncbi:uncharacterized protein PV09_06743 [Verruconis gallopava]|uniref:SH3 domain-containing protein n=1 Tax=Verruconis gallopava TaxID=253628 RepID=A0A0D2A5T7_9PEZI|nr:uncharacterized protein PV09_06743 [Verruconis gallopava]KIW01900.1 hypothetical protein PV09_06743 [Verruconis gallopava]
MAHLDMLKSGDYAAVIAYVTEYVVVVDFLHSSEITLDLVVGEEVEVIFRDDEKWWFGRLIGTHEKGVFPASCVRKKWPVPLTGHGRNDRHFTSFTALPSHIREKIYDQYFGLEEDAAIRVVRPAERDAILAQPTQLWIYQDSAGVTRTTRLLRKTDIFATSRFVAKDIVHWLILRYRLRIVTYDTTTSWFQERDDASDDFFYPPRTASLTLPLVRFTRAVNRLEVDVKYLINIPQMIAKSCDLCKITSLRLTFRAYSTAIKGYYLTFKDVVHELESLEHLRVKDEVEFIWIEMEEMCETYSALDRETYCRGFLEAVEILKRKIRTNWIKQYAPQRLLTPLGVTKNIFKK